MAEVQMEQAPRKAREHFEKGLASFERGNLDYAMDMFLLALELCPGLLKARKFLRAAAVKKAKQQKTSALTRAFSTLGGTGTLMKVQSLAKKNPIEAVREAEDLLRKDPLNLTFLNAASDAAEAADMPEVALLNLELAREHNPSDAKVVEKLGSLYKAVNRMHDARMAYETLVRLRPTDPNAVKLLKDATALATMQQGGWNEATSYRDVMKDSKQATLLEQQAKAVKTAGDIDSLIEETRGKIEREPQNVNYKRALAELLAKAERFDEALGILAEAQQAMGGADPQIDRLISTIKVTQIDQAIKAFDAAGNEAAATAKRQEKAAFLFQNSEDLVRRYPNDLQFKYDLAVLLYERGQINEAIQQLQRAQQNPQRRIRSLYYLALCFKQKQQYDIAAEQLEKAAAELHLMDETKKDILYELGTIREAMGQPEKAVEHYKDIYAVDIGFRDVTAKIEKAYKKS